MVLTSCWAQSQGGWGRGGDPLIWMICQESRQNFKQELNLGPLTIGYVKLCLESIMICHLILSNGVTKITAAQTHASAHTHEGATDTNVQAMQIHWHLQATCGTCTGHRPMLLVFHGRH